MKTVYSLLVLAAALVLAPIAKADSIAFESHVGNAYTYDLTIDHSPTVFFLDGFSLTDLTGVTNAYLTGDLADDFHLSFDSDSVTVWTLFDIKRSRKVPFSLGTLTIVSSAAAGSVDYSILDSNGLFCGTVTGPDSNGDSSIPAVPEPSTLLMMGTGLLSAAGAARRKLLN